MECGLSRLIVGISLIAFLAPLALAQKTRDEQNPFHTWIEGRKEHSHNSPSPTPGKPSQPKPDKRPTTPPKRVLGLGYTLFQRNAAGRPVTVDPRRTFRTGDAVRILIESTSDGYLYVFNTENDGAAQMIFPDVRLNNGLNFIRAHVPLEIPSSREANPLLRWFTFNDPPATERLYLVLARNPLPGIAIGDELIKYCQTYQRSCPWRPPAGEWQQLIAKVQEPGLVGQAESFGQVESEANSEALGRGIGLPPDAPPPSTIKLGKSDSVSAIVMVLKLDHK